MLDKMACETEAAQDLHSPKGQEQAQDPIMRRATRSVNCSKNLKILTPAELSDSDKENVNFNKVQFYVHHQPTMPVWICFVTACFPWEGSSHRSTPSALDYDQHRRQT
jgi:hypothetical protein